MKRSDFLFTIAGTALTLFATPSLFAENKKMSRKEFEEFLKKQVKTAENGDVYFDVPEADRNIIIANLKLRSGGEISSFHQDNAPTKYHRLRTSYVDPIILDLICYYKPILDIKKYYDLLDLEKKKFEKEQKEEKKRKYSVKLPKPDKIKYIPDMLEDFFRANKMSLRPMSFSKEAIKRKLKEGKAYIIFTPCRSKNNELEQRNEKRKEFKNILEWIGTLNEMKLDKEDLNGGRHGLITGFNETSDEYRISITPETSIWITGNELKKSLITLVDVVF